MGSQLGGPKRAWVSAERRARAADSIIFRLDSSPESMESNARHFAAWAAWYSLTDFAADYVCTRALEGVSDSRGIGPSEHQLARDIFGHLFLPQPSVRTDCQGPDNATISSLAEAIYDSRAFEQLPILADALEDAGCAELAILNHVRSPGPHARGCWALDLVLGRH